MGAPTSARSARKNEATPKKRSRDEMLGGKSTGTQSKPVLISDDQDDDDVILVKTKKAARPRPKDDEEKRLKRFRVKAPGAWLERRDRAVNQRMFLINRERTEVNGVPQETFELAGTTGNVYSIKISHVPCCTCPDSKKGNVCKHIIYVLHLVLKAPAELEYQAAFLTSELKEIFERSLIPQSEADHDHSDGTQRKTIEGDCPICFMEFDEANEDIIWCKAACGNNIHKECFEKWAKSSGGNEVRCVYCRTAWKGDEVSIDRIRAAKENRSANVEGYINIASELGISTYRETSSYHQRWVNSQYRRGQSFDTR